MVPVKKVPVGCKTETSVNSWPAQTPRAHFSCDVVGGFGFAALPVLYNHVARAFNPSSSRRGQWPRAKHRLREPRPFYRYTVQYCFVRVRLPCVLRTFGRFPRVHHFRQKVQYSTGEKFLFSACLRVFSGTASCLCRVPNEALRRAARARRVACLHSQAK